MPILTFHSLFTVQPSNLDIRRATRFDFEPLHRSYHISSMLIYTSHLAKMSFSASCKGKHFAENGDLLKTLKKKFLTECDPASIPFEDFTVTHSFIADITQKQSMQYCFRDLLFLQ